jgi:DNA polymerase-3 subunit beta
VKLRADRASLVDAIAWVGQAIPKKESHAALAGMRLQADGDSLTLYAFDYETSHRATIEADVASAGECLVPGKFLRDVVGSMKGETVELVLDGERLTASAGRSTYRVQGLSVDDYPKLPEFPDVVGEVSAGALMGLVSSVRHPIDDATPHPQVRGLHIDGADDVLTMVGASAPTLAIAGTEWRGKTFRATVHSKAAQAALKGLIGRVEIGHTEGHLGFRDAERQVTMRCYADEYAAWRKLIREPKGDVFTADADAAELLDAVKRASTLSNDTTPIAIDVRPGEIEISIAGNEAGEGSEVLEVECDGEIRLGMNPRLLTDALAATDTQRVQLGFLTAKTPVVLRPADHPQSVFIVMPKPIPGEQKS